MLFNSKLFNLKVCKIKKNNKINNKEMKKKLKLMS